MKRILVLDDDAFLRDLMGTMLEGEGYEVVTAASGEEGVKKFESKPFDLVITDHNMPPGMNGEQLIAEIRRLKPRQPIVLYSANDELMSRLEKSPGDFKILRKPASMGRVLAAVSEATKISLVDRIIRFIAKIMA